MTAESSTTAARVYLDKSTVALFDQRIIDNRRVVYVDANHKSNNRGYDILIFTNEDLSIGQGAFTVVLHDGQWHKAPHDKRANRPFLGKPRPDVHEFDVLFKEPRSVKAEVDSASESEDSQSEVWDNEPVQNPTSTPDPASIPLPSETAPTDSPIRPARFLPVYDMATQTQTTTTTTTGGGRSGPPPTSSSTATSTPTTDLVQQIQTAFNAAFSRSRGGGGPGGTPSGGGGGPSAPGPPGGGGAPPNPAIPPAQVPIAAAADVRTMGTAPRTFTGKRDEAEDWLDKLRGYYRANIGVPGFESPIRKVALALTFMDGPEVAEWTRTVGAWIDTLDPIAQNIPYVWETFQTQFLDQFAD